MLPKVDFPSPIEGEDLRDYNLLQLRIAKIQAGRLDNKVMEEWVRDFRAEIFALFMRGKWRELRDLLTKLLDE